jgi:hypothetical protein
MKLSLFPKADNLYSVRFLSCHLIFITPPLSCAILMLPASSNAMPSWSAQGRSVYFAITRPVRVVTNSRSLMSLMMYNRFWGASKCRSDRSVTPSENWESSLQGVGWSALSASGTSASKIAEMSSGLSSANAWLATRNVPPCGALWIRHEGDALKVHSHRAQGVMPAAKHRAIVLHFAQVTLVSDDKQRLSAGVKHDAARFVKSRLFDVADPLSREARHDGRATRFGLNHRGIRSWRTLCCTHS